MPSGKAWFAGVWGEYSIKKLLPHVLKGRSFYGIKAKVKVSNYNESGWSVAD